MVLRSGVAAVRDGRPPQSFRPFALLRSGDAQLLTVAIPSNETTDKSASDFIPFSFRAAISVCAIGKFRTHTSTGGGGGGGGAFMVHKEAAFPDGHVAASADLRIRVKHLRRDVRENADA